MAENVAIHHARVSDLNSEGWGVARTEAGEVVFVPGTWPGDEIRFSILSRGKFALGKVDSFVKKSSAHRQSPCPFSGFASGRCGTCPWIGIHYEAQLAAKSERIKKLLARFALAPKKLHPIAAAPSEWAYRNRLKLQSDGKALGYKNPITFEIAPISRCAVAEDWINDEIATLLKSPLARDEYWISKDKGAAFAQGNTAQNAAMKNVLARELQEAQGCLFAEGAELFCGDGNFSEVLATRVAKLSCFEGASAAIEDLKKKKFFPVKAFTLDLYARLAEKEILKRAGQSSLLFLDPPRSGFRELANLVAQMPQLEQIIYVSCDPITFCRDCAKLPAHWTFATLHSFDMFPQTPHIEVMGFFRRNEEPPA